MDAVLVRAREALPAIAPRLDVGGTVGVVHLVRLEVVEETEHAVDMEIELPPASPAHASADGPSPISSAAPSPSPPPAAAPPLPQGQPNLPWDDFVDGNGEEGPQDEREQLEECADLLFGSGGLQVQRIDGDRWVVEGWKNGGPEVSLHIDLGFEGGEN